MAYRFGSNDPDTLKGTDGDDWLHGWDSDNEFGDLGPPDDGDLLQGLAGNDELLAGAGDDRVEGGGGSDVLYGGSGTNTLYGGAGDDRLFNYSDFPPFSSNGLLYGGDGNDHFGDLNHGDSAFGGSGDDTIDVTVENMPGLADGGDGIDMIRSFGYDSDAAIQLNLSAPVMTFNGQQIFSFEVGYVAGSAGADHLTGASLNDTFYGGDGDDFLSGMDGDDILAGSLGSDTLQGGAGDDSLYATGFFGEFSAGDIDVVSGGAGIDYLELDLANGDDGAQRITVGAEFSFGSGSTATGIEQIYLRTGAGDDTLTGGNLDDSIYGGDGANQLFGGRGDDELVAGEGRDRIYGGDGNDGIWGSSGADLLSGLDGNDTLHGGLGNVTIEGGAGDDWILASNDLGDDSPDGVNVISGGAGIDRLDLDLSGADFGPQLITVADSFHFGSGSSVTGIELISVQTGTGDDTLSGGNLGDTLDGGDGANHLSGGRGDDDLQTGAGQDLIHGGEGEDDLEGGDGDNQLFGDAGDDHLTSGSGLDLLSGGDGDDFLSGGNGRDTLIGGSGVDWFDGGKGHDHFDFVTAPLDGEEDQMRRFETEKDLIRLSAAAFDALPLGNLRDHSFVLGKRALDHNDHLLYDPATGAVRYDADGKGGAAAVHFLTVTSAEPLTADDFKVI
jgi:Ca2+-binding RTX toxin-like protein